VESRVKQAAGDLTNDLDPHDVDEAAETQDAFGNARAKSWEVIQDIGKAVKK
jgi:methyl-accepting chemotaxis protein